MAFAHYDEEIEEIVNKIFDNFDSLTRAEVHELIEELVVDVQASYG